MAEPSLKECYDVVVVGAGPAGASAARAAARQGVKVLFLDRKQRIGVPVQCGELVTKWISHHAAFSSKAILQSIETMAFHISDGRSPEKIYETKNPGYMLDRSLFDRELAAAAISAGAKVLSGKKAVGLSRQGLWVESGLDKELVEAKVIIGADGVHSLIASWIGLPVQKTIVALQYEVVIEEAAPRTEVFFSPEYEGGYAWFFPKRKTANIGLGIIPARTASLADLLDRFIDRLTESKKLSWVNVIGKTGGSVPCGGARKAVHGNILLAGDAAGHAHPMTGAGIFNAVTGGEIAGTIAAEAVLKGDLKHLENYDAHCQEAFGKALAYGKAKRELFEKKWNDPQMNFNDLIRETWVTFKEYYRGRVKTRSL